MRIAFITYGSLEQTTGGYIYDRRLVAGLRERGHEVTSVSLSPGDRGWPAGLDGFDVVIEDELAHPSLVERGQRQLDPRPRVVSLVHNLTCLQPATVDAAACRERERDYFREVDGVIAVCADTLAGVREVSGRGDELPATVAHPGADHLLPGRDGPPMSAAEVRSRAVGPGLLRALFVGTLSAAKGAHRALAAAVTADIELEIAGRQDMDPEYVAKLQRRIAEQSREDRVHLRGELEPGALADLYRSSHLLVLPSDREAYPLVALEALGFGLPVLLTSQGGTAEILAGSDSGLLLAPDDAPAWAAALDTLHRDRSRLVDMSLAALARHARHPRWTDTAVAVERLLQGLKQ